MPSGFEGFKMPRAPRRYQSELDAARHEKNVLRDELQEVRRENRKLKAQIAVMRTNSRALSGEQKP